jgi:UDP-glucose 4-epimerase
LFEREGWLSTVALRFFNVFGPRQDPASPYAAAVPAFIRRALSGEPLTIFGDGEQSRDFIYVKDVVSSVAFAAETSELTGVFNCGYGRQMTINELVRQIRTLAESESALNYLPERLGDVRHSCASMEKFRACGWRPASTLEEGLRETMAGFRQHLSKNAESSR